MKTKIVEYIGRIQDGGAETLVKEYALLLDKDLFDVVILCDDYKMESANYKILKDNNISVIDMFGANAFICKVLRRIFKGRFRAILFDKEIERIKPDIIHVHLESLETLRYSKKLNGIKLFYTCHNPPEIMIGSKNKIENESAEFLLKNNGLRFIALHEDMAKEINKMFGINNCSVIKNGIYLERFGYVSRTKEEIRKELGIPEKAYVIGNNGRFSYQKNHEFILNVFAEINKMMNNAFLILIGRGKLETQIRKQVRALGLDDKVLILSNRSDVPDLLKSMDVFLFPSRFEGLGIALIEAQASGLPCVVSERIPQEAFQSNQITVMSLDDSVTNWANACIDPKCNIDHFGDIEEYDIKAETKKLGMLYLS